jgi:hypothetical protein
MVEEVSVTKINIGRVLAGGLVAGVVANLLDFVWYQYLMVRDMEVMIQRLGLNRAVVEGTSLLVTWTVVDFLYGILLVWTYAAFRPRCGPGPATAVYAALAPFAAVTMFMYGYTAMGVFAMNAFLKGSLFFLITSVAAALTGASIYREDT